MSLQPTNAFFSRRHLPHWMVTNHSYTVTMRLKGSLPTAVIAQLSEERGHLLEAMDSEEVQRRRFLRVDAILDGARIGHTHLKHPKIAAEVMQALEYLETFQGWMIHALCLMPNHVHVVLRHPTRNHELSQDLGRLKGVTARYANQILGMTGTSFWMDEHFDHWLRGDESFIRAVRYVAQNPVKAGLVKHWRDWSWTRVRPDLEHLIDDFG